LNNKEKYIAFCKKNNTSSIFMQAFWLDAVNSNWDVMYYSKNNIEYFLPYIAESKLGFQLIRNPYFVPYTTIQTYAKNIDAAVNHFELELKKNAHIDLHLPPIMGNEKSWKPNDLELKKLHTNIIDLQLEISVLYNNLKDNCRRQIKKAEKNITVQVNGTAATTFAFINITYKKAANKMPYSFQLIENLVNICKKNECGNILVATDQNGTEIAMLWVVWDANTMYYLISGIADSHQNSGAMNLLVWQAIQMAKNLNCHYFDFEGSRHKGIDTFFKSFGGNQIPYDGIHHFNSMMLKTLMRIKNSF
jgi:lipid II:glycine glycyltransferase (peptidoglycan interpeptide bridge formation enzyme)